MSDQNQPGVYPVPEETVLEACHDRPLPEMGTIRQTWETDPIPDDEVAAVAATTLDDLDLDSVPDGGSVAVGVGSRGINNLPAIVRGVVEELQARGYEPFVFPAMGSHGGATADGQRAKLDALGVNEETVGCPVRATMEVVEVGRTPERDIPAVADANAAAADAILPINRVKAHTDFQGEVESGLSKMLVIGMGKQRGAKTAHEWSVDWSLREMLPEISTLLREELPVVGGVAIVEDQHDDTAIVEGVPPSGFLDREAELLETSYELHAHHPVRRTRRPRRRPDGEGHQRVRHGHERDRAARVRIRRTGTGTARYQAHLRPIAHRPLPRERDRARLRGPDPRGPPRGDGHLEVADQLYHGQHASGDPRAGPGRDGPGRARRLPLDRRRRRPRTPGWPGSPIRCGSKSCTSPRLSSKRPVSDPTWRS